MLFRSSQIMLIWFYTNLWSVCSLSAAVIKAKPRHTKFYDIHCHFYSDNIICYANEKKNDIQNRSIFTMVSDTVYGATQRLNVNVVMHLFVLFSV